MNGDSSAERKNLLRQRTKRFAGEVVRFFCALDRRREELNVIGKKLLRSGTSVAANYREASRARTAAEFIAKIELCSQEADESLLWLELLRDDCGIAPALVDPLWSEADEMIAIFGTMSKHTKSGSHASGA